MLRTLSMATREREKEEKSGRGGGEEEREEGEEEEGWVKGECAESLCEGELMT